MSLKAAILLIVVLAVARIAGAIGFPQIVGSVQRFEPARIFTIILWLAILAAGWYTVHRFFPGGMIALYLGYGWSLVDTFRAGRIN